jgi:hypothetical protein
MPSEAKWSVAAWVPQIGSLRRAVGRGQPASSPNSECCALNDPAATGFHWSAVLGENYAVDEKPSLAIMEICRANGRR